MPDYDDVQVPADDVVEEAPPAEEAPSAEAAPPVEEIPPSEEEDNPYSDSDIVFDEFVGNNGDLGGDIVDDVFSDDVPGASLDGAFSDSDGVLSDADSADDVDSVEDDVETDTDVSTVEDDTEENLVPDSPKSTVYLLSFDGESVPFTVTALDSLDALPASVVSSSASYTPQAFQTNLAENRRFGEHYLMWAQKVSYGSSYYWRYYLVLGSDITYASNVYRYTDAEVYTYYTYSSQVTYDVSVSSGSVNGNSYLVYSDLYFDYVGVDPAVNGSVYIYFALFMIIIVLLILGGKRNV